MDDLTIITKKVSQILNGMKQKFLPGDAPVTPDIPPKQEVNRNPIFVFQMGRVGSNSIKLSLHNVYQSLSLDVPIYHAHYMNRFEEIEARARHDLTDQTAFIRDLQLAKALRNQLESLADSQDG